jgi:Flp pilus assembly protein TadG
MSIPRHMARRLKAWAARLALAQEAVAAVEFALIMPLMLTLYLGSLELSQLITVDQRVTNIAGTVGDLVSRSNGTVTAASLTDYFTAATAIISPLPTTGLTQVVTEYSIDATTGKATVKWSRAYNGGTAKLAGTVYNASTVVPVSMTSISKGSWVIASEATYPYIPLLGLFFKTSFTLYHQNFYAPRYAAVICYITTTC